MMSDERQTLALKYLKRKRELLKSKINKCQIELIFINIDAKSYHEEMMMIILLAIKMIVN